MCPIAAYVYGGRHSTYRDLVPSNPHKTLKTFTRGDTSPRDNRSWTRKPQIFPSPVPHGLHVSSPPTSPDAPGHPAGSNPTSGELLGAPTARTRGRTRVLHPAVLRHVAAAQRRTGTRVPAPRVSATAKTPSTLVERGGAHVARERRIRGRIGATKGYILAWLVQDAII
jgi:hypothetical protein